MIRTSTLSQMCLFVMTMGMCFITLPPPPIIYEAIDLGLPSGTKWAAQNVGARKPSDAGFYFQWGDTSGYTTDQVGTGEGQKKFASDWSDYKWYLSGSGYGVNFTKYTTKGASLELEDDAAHVNMGGDWHMPTPTQIQELIDNTSNEWTTLDGISGYSFTSKKDESKFIFIPAAGGALDGSVEHNGSNTYVWSSMLHPNRVYSGENLGFGSKIPDVYPTFRFYGYSVRGVIG